MKDEYIKLSNLIHGKRVLYIPIYSCFDYKTKALNFKADGNVNRMLSTFSHIKSFKHLDIACPLSGNDYEWFSQAVAKIGEMNNTSICLKETSLIVESSKVQRDIGFASKIIDLVDGSSYDTIIAEAQFVVLMALDKLSWLDVIYWCPVCATDEKTRDFLEPHKSIDKYIFSRVKNAIIASEDQEKYIDMLKSTTNVAMCNTIMISTLIDRSLPFFSYKLDESVMSSLQEFTSKGHHVLFLPFRLTDMGYKFKEILDVITHHKNGKSLAVLYTNPNNCDLGKIASSIGCSDYVNEHFIQVSKDRDTYYTILDYVDCMVPYLEDTKFINHAATCEIPHEKMVETIGELEKYLDNIQ